TPSQHHADDLTLTAYHGRAGMIARPHVDPTRPIPVVNEPTPAPRAADAGAAPGGTLLDVPIEALPLPHGEPAYRRAQLVDWLYVRGETDFAAMPNPPPAPRRPALRRRAARRAALRAGRVRLGGHGDPAARPPRLAGGGARRRPVRVRAPLPRARRLGQVPVHAPRRQADGGRLHALR